MPRNYKRKSNRGEWSEDSMNKALDAVKNGMPYKTASKQFSVPVMTLKRRVKGKNKVAVDAIKYLGGKKTVFTADQEIDLVNHIKDMETRMYGLTRQDVLSLAYQLAVKNNIPHPFQREKAGYDWLRGFRQRHSDITLRAPESTSAARARAFNKPVVDKFFSVLKSIQQNKNHPPHRIFNVDETGLSTVPTKNTKVFAGTGRKQVARVTSAERGETTTVVICMSASGSFVPPMFIFKRIRMKIELMDGAPPGSIWACNSSGWMNLDVFTQWFDHFLRHTKPSAEDPVLLILDGHLSHTKNLDLILKARENYVTIVCLPPHCTHKLQPLDVSLMYPLSVYHNQSLEKWMNNNPGRPVNVFKIAKIFGEAYLKAAVMSNAINGFSKTGIHPLNPDVFSESDYLAAATTDIEYNEEFSAVEIPNNELPPTMNLSPPQTVTSQDLVDVQNKTPPSTPVCDGDFSVRNPLSPLPSTSYVRNTSVSPSILEDTQCQPFNITPAHIHPLPKIAGKRSSLKRKRMDTTILTSTPYKNYLEEEKDKKTNKENRKTQKELNAKKTQPKKKQKGKGIGKGMSNKKKQKYVSSEDEEDEDVECLFCTESYAKDNRGEGWIRCGMCQRWGHEACAGIDSDDPDEFTCDLCTTAPGKRRLEL